MTLNCDDTSTGPATSVATDVACASARVRRGETAGAVDEAPLGIGDWQLQATSLGRTEDCFADARKDEDDYRSIHLVKVPCNC